MVICSFLSESASKSQRDPVIEISAKKNAAMTFVRACLHLFLIRNGIIGQGFRFHNDEAYLETVIFLRVNIVLSNI